jgi:hypothetical protein
MAVVLLLGLLGLVGYSVWSAGYNQGMVAAAGTAETVVPAPGYYPGYWGFPGFWGFGLIFKAFFAFLIIGLIIRFTFGWGRWGGYRGGYWRGGPWPEHREQMMEDRLARWHDQAHGHGEDSTDGS